MTHPEVFLSRVKRAELLSSIGAGVLGGGIALMLATVLERFALPILLLGIVAHTVGMTQKHSLEQQGEHVRMAWSEALYWSCWVLLAALALFIVYRLI